MKYLLMPITAVLLFGCNNSDENHVYGKWTAVHLIGDSISMEKDFSQVKLILHKDNRFYYSGGLKVPDIAGAFEVERSLLTLSDTTSDGGETYNLGITEVKEDSLLLRMNYEGNEVLLQLVRE